MNKRVYRSRKDRVIAGVCGGLAKYFSIDPVLIRLVAVATVLLGGAGVILYIIAMLVIPEEPKFSSNPSNGENSEENKESGFIDPELRNKAIVGIAVFFIAVGVFFLLRQFEPVRWFLTVSWEILFGGILVAIGIIVIMKSIRRSKR